MSSRTLRLLGDRVIFDKRHNGASPIELSFRHGAKTSSSFVFTNGLQIGRNHRIRENAEGHLIVERVQPDGTFRSVFVIA